MTRRPKPSLSAATAETTPTAAFPERLCHPMVLRTEKLLVSGKEDEKKHVRPKESICLHVRVSRDQLSRALRILNTLLLTLEERGCTFSWPEEWDSRLSLIMDGETLEFGICEIVEAKRYVCTGAKKKHPFMAPRWKYRLTGRLRLFVGKIPYASKGRNSWSDTRDQRLEDCLESFVLGLRSEAARIRQNRVEVQERERRWAEEQETEDKERSREIEENRKVSFVTELMNDWNRSHSLRAFATAMAKAAELLKLSDQGKNEIQQVVDWTRDYAGVLDPLKNLPDSVREFANPEKNYSWLGEEE